MAIETPRSRRQLLSAAVAAAGGALAAHAAGISDAVEAANGDTVRVGQSFTGTSLTSITNTGSSSTAVGFQGVVSNSGAGTIGVWGQSNGSGGSGVYGVATGTATGTMGVHGRSVNGRGVYGQATGTSGGSYGVYGTSDSLQGIGVYGSSQYAGLYGDGGDYGVVAYGDSDGVFGHGLTGVYGEGTQYAMYAIGGTYGLYTKGSTYGVYATSAQYAGYFKGKVHVAGTLSATTKHFLIDHPQDPANRTLSHACVEAPEMLTVYSGTVTLGADGSATVRLPRYFGALNTGIRYQLTALDGPAPDLHVARRMEGNRFGIGGGAAGQEVCWQVTGVRHDASAKRSPLRVEQAKARADRGRYLDPAAFGKPASAAMHPVPRVKVPRVRRPGRVRPAA
jgi:hypothetical protein